MYQISVHKNKHKNKNKNKKKQQTGKLTNKRTNKQTNIKTSTKFQTSIQTRAANAVSSIMQTNQRYKFRKKKLKINSLIVSTSSKAFGWVALHFKDRYSWRLWLYKNSGPIFYPFFKISEPVPNIRTAKEFSENDILKNYARALILINWNRFRNSPLNNEPPDQKRRSLILTLS